MSTKPCILCPQDFSRCSEEALKHACALAVALKQPIELMHVYQLQYLAEPAAGAGIGLTLEGLEILRKRAAELLEGLRVGVDKLGIEATVRLVEGSPASLIAERAQSPEISMVVMGTHGRSAMGRLLLGSTAERVLRTAKVPVMTVRLAD